MNSNVKVNFISKGTIILNGDNNYLNKSYHPKDLMYFRKTVIFNGPGPGV